MNKSSNQHQVTSIFHKQVKEGREVFLESRYWKQKSAEVVVGYHNIFGIPGYIYDLKQNGKFKLCLLIFLLIFLTIFNSCFFLLQF